MPTRYHRLARETPAYAWWRLPVAGVLGLGLYLGLTFALLIVALAAYAIVSDVDELRRWLAAAGELNLQEPDFFALDLLSLAILIPAVLLAVRITGPRPVGYLSSVAGHLRWRWLGRTAVISFLVFVVTIGGSLALTEATDPGEVQAPSHLGTRVILVIAIIVLVVPFQAAAEEYVFRGYLMQLIGSWTRFAFIPVICSVPLFVAGHVYELWGLVDVGIFGLTAAVLTIRTGGLEAAIAAHTANNVVLFVLDALGMIAATDSSGAGPVDVIPTVISSMILLLWVEWAARRAGIARTRDPIPEPPPPELPMWPPPPYAMIWWPPPVQQVAPQWNQWQPPPQQPQWQPPVPPVGAPAAPRLHPDTPDYPGELPPGWDS